MNQSTPFLLSSHDPVSFQFSNSTAMYAKSATNSCHNYVDTYPDMASATTSKVVFGFICVSTFVFGILGNSTMLYVTLCNQSMITVQNIFIMSLAVSDLMICLISVPITPIFLIYKEWYFGKPLCHIIVWVQGASVVTTTYTLMAIALDRYYLITYPHKKPLSIPASLYITALIWVSGALSVSPYAYFMRTVTYEGVCGEFCDEHWPSKTFQEAFTTTILVVQYVVPFTVISYCYWAVLRRLQCHIREKIDRLSYRTMEAVALSKRKRRSTIILACMVLVFGACWLPQNVISMIGNYARSLLPDDWIYFVYLIAHCIAMQSISANPILYAWLNSAFRRVVFDGCARARKRMVKLLQSDRSLRRAKAERTQSLKLPKVQAELCTDYLLRKRPNNNSLRSNEQYSRDPRGRMDGRLEWLSDTRSLLRIPPDMAMKGAKSDSL